MKGIKSRITRNDFEQEVCARIRARMDYLDISQAKLARITGLDPMNINHYYNGTSCPIAYHIAIIAEALITTPDKLMKF